MSTSPQMKHGKGPNHGKSKNTTRMSKRRRHHSKAPAKKNRRVLRSSHGKWTHLKLTAHRERAERNRRQP